MTTHEIGCVWIQRVSRKRRTGQYIVRRKVDPVALARAEAVSFKGDTRYGIPVSTYSRHLIFGVVIRKARGQKLVSKHETIESAMAAADGLTEVL